ncbi:Twitching mobility protein [[Clostridium] cellulosi]|jgi:pilus retraction protein PilT|uniref:Twitching mobility protein n=1 Tax=[Clostridium] cellulosi TaxID=29343 RepID=A0A078KQI9_9FIRM|nr:MAG: type IV pilus twitching motility protein PilT [[Clostridium] cellulosi]CDZ23359.1 Twitching mobility protein [[Clostridium] cellulosi]
MSSLEDFLLKAMAMNASDLHITVAVPPMVRINGQLQPLEGVPPLTPEQTRDIVLSMMTPAQAKVLETKGQVDFSYVIPKKGRFRVNVFKQRRSYSAAVRILVQEMPTIDDLGLPSMLKEFVLKPHGLILITGPTGSGKSTTLAAMVDYLNRSKRCHVLTIEDPIEYLHKHNKSIINQREVGDDTSSFSDALRSALREDPDVILVGEMRDLETISTALSAAETGHLVLSTLHTMGAAQTVDRIVDMFPPHQQQQIRMQLASVLQGILTQQLILNKSRTGRVAAFELLIVNDAVRNLIRENKCYQIATVMQNGIKDGMIPMDYCLSRLVMDGKISTSEALNHCSDAETLKHYLSNKGSLRQNYTLSF